METKKFTIDQLLAYVRDEKNQVIRKILYGFERFLDEGKYEDFEEYKTYFKNELPNLDIVKITKRPFKLTLQCTDGQFFISMKATKGEITYTLAGRRN